MSNARKRIYQSKAWKQIRLAYALSKHCICERCGRSVYVDGINEYLPKDMRLRYVVHHKTYLNDTNYTDDSIAYDSNNLELLCLPCHNAIHNTSSSTKEGLVFDENGNLKKKVEIKRNL